MVQREMKVMVKMKHTNFSSYHIISKIYAFIHHLCGSQKFGLRNDTSKVEGYFELQVISTDDEDVSGKRS